VIFAGRNVQTVYRQPGARVARNSPGRSADCRLGNRTLNAVVAGSSRAQLTIISNGLVDIAKLSVVRYQKEPLEIGSTLVYHVRYFGFGARACFPRGEIAYDSTTVLISAIVRALTQL
jgi:hypothetical protein